MTVDRDPLEQGFHVPPIWEQAAMRRGGLEWVEEMWDEAVTRSGPVPYPETAVAAVRQVLRIVSAGYAVELAPRHTVITAEEAAAILGVPVADVGIPEAHDRGVVELEEVVARRDELRATAPTTPGRVTGEHPEPLGVAVGRVGPWEIAVAGERGLKIGYNGGAGATDVELRLTADGVPEPVFRLPEVSPDFRTHVISAAPRRAARRMITHLRERQAQGYRTYAVEVTAPKATAKGHSPKWAEKPPALAVGRVQPEPSGRDDCSHLTPLRA